MLQEINIGDTVQNNDGDDDSYEFVIVGWFINPRTGEEGALMEGGTRIVRSGSSSAMSFFDEIARENDSVREFIVEAIDRQASLSWELINILRDSDQYKVLKRAGNKTISGKCLSVKPNLTDEQISNRRFFFGDLEKPHRNVNSGLEFL